MTIAGASDARGRPCNGHTSGLPVVSARCDRLGRNEICAGIVILMGFYRTKQMGQWEGKSIVADIITGNRCVDVL